MIIMHICIDKVNYLAYTSLSIRVDSRIISSDKGFDRPAKQAGDLLGIRAYSRESQTGNS